jgi:hypothetical protein
MEVLLARHGAGASEKGQADQNSQEKSLHAQEAPTFFNPREALGNERSRRAPGLDLCLMNILDADWT